MQKVTIHLSDEIYKNILFHAQKKKLTVEEFLETYVCNLFSEELSDFEPKVN